MDFKSYKFAFQMLGVSFLTLALIGCDNQNQSGIIGGDRMMGHGNVAQPPANTQVEPQGRRSRANQFSFQQASPQEMMQCAQVCRMGQCPISCQRNIHDMLSRGISPDYYQFMPQVGLFDGLFGGGNRQGQGQGYTFDYNSFEMADPQWVGDYRSQGIPQGYTPMHNMQQFCQNPSMLAHESVNLPSGYCENLDMNYLMASAYANNGYNHYIQGNPQAAQQDISRIQAINQQGCVGQGKSAGECFKIRYGTYWGSRNVKEENNVIEEDLKRTWDNLKALPKNAGLRMADGLLNMMMTRAMLPVAQLDARLAGMNYSQAQRLNYYESMAAHYHNALPIPVYMTGGNCDHEYASGQGASDYRSQSFVVGQVDQGQGDYLVTCQEQ